MKNQLTTAVAVFAATSVLLLGIGAALAATTSLSPFAPGSLNAVSCAAGSGPLKNFSVTSASESVSCPLPATTTTVAPATTTTTVAPTTTTSTAKGAWACTSNEPISDLTQAPAGWTGSTYYVTWENSVCGGSTAPAGTGLWTDTTNFTGHKRPLGHRWS